MTTSLPKGANVSLSTADPSLRRLLVALGWRTRPRSGQAVELDAAVLLVGSDGKVPNAAHFVAYDALPPQAPGTTGPGSPAVAAPPGAVDDDAEQVEVDLEDVPAYVDRIVFAVSIRDARQRRQTFADVRDHYLRVANADTGVELARYDLHAGASSETAMVFGEVYRHRSGSWKLRAVGQGWADGLGGIARDYGVPTGAT